MRELIASGHGVEVAYLAGVLQQLAPDTHREAALAAARDLLAMPLTTRASNPLDRSDREYLYGILTTANDHTYVAQAREQLLLPDGRVDRGDLQQVLREQSVAVAAQAWHDSRIAPDEKDLPSARPLVIH